LSSTIHSFPSTPPLIDQSSRPATLSNQPLFQLPTPSTSIFSPFRQTRLRNQTSVARFWVLESLGSAGRRIVESATAGIGTRLTDSGWNLHLYNPPTTHNLAHRTSHQPYKFPWHILHLVPTYPFFIACTPGISCSTKARQIDNRSIFTLPRGPDPPDLLLWTWDTPIREIRTQWGIRGTPAHSHIAPGQENLVKAPSWSSGSRSIKSNGLLHGSNHTPSAH